MGIDRFDVKRAGKEAVFVSHPLGKSKMYEVKNPDEFWQQSVEEQRDAVIDAYISQIDFENSPVMAVSQILEDAEDKDS